MNRYEFMRQLEMLLSDITPSERQEALQYYNDYFDDAGVENEQNVVKALGSPAKVAASIKADLTGNAAAGEFTETGYKDSYSRNQEIMKYGQPDQNTADQEKSSQSENSRNQNSSYYNNPYSSGSYANNPYRTKSAADSGNTGNTNAQNGTYQGNSGSSADFNNNGGYTGASGKSGMSGTTLALVIVLCIFGIPILLPLGIVLLGIVIAVVAVIASLFIAFAAVAFSLIIVGVVLLAVGITKLFAMPFGAMCLAGGGLACIGVGILFALLTIWLCVTVVPAVIKVIADSCRKLFSRRKTSKV